MGRRSVLYVGRKLNIHKKRTITKKRKSVASAAKKTKSKYRSLKKVHIVKRGEYLSKIAKRYNMSVSKLAKLNGISMRKNIDVGQRLSLVSKRAVRSRSAVAKVSSKFTHKVKSGENLNLLARKFGTTIKAIKKQNGLRSTKLKIGQRLKIKRGNVNYHVVKRGDNLIAIAKKYKVSLGKLLSINNFKNKSKINIGSRVKIPLVSMN